MDTFDTQVTRGEVTLEVTPRWEDGKLLVELRANTHTVELSRLDLGAQTRLLVGDREIAPASAGKLLGHHGRAILVFRLKERPERFVIEIRDVPDVPLRRLIWPLGDASP